MKKVLIVLCSFALFSSADAQEDKDAVIETLRNEVRNLIKINESLRAENNQLKSQNAQMSNVGEEFRVQLGILNSILSSLKDPKPMSGSMKNGKMVYDIGGFDDPSEAFKLSQELRKLDLSGAFVTKYVNGVRDYDFRFDASRPSSSSYPKTNYNSYPTNPYPTYDDESGSFKSNRPVIKSKTMSIE